MGTALYALRGLSHVYRGHVVLSIDRLELPRGGIIGIIGPNGSGKSTFLRLAGFIEKPTQGEILFEGKPVGPFSSEVRNRVALLPQEPFLMKRTVLNNVAYGLRIRKVVDNIEERVDRALSYVGLNGKDFAQRPSFALSGGEAQRVALAARLILKPEVLLLDEPTASIDSLSAQLIKDAALKAGRDWGTTLIIASHDWQWLYGVCDKVFHLLKGRFLSTGRENVLFGPWEPMENGLWGRTLSDGQRVRVPKPPEPLAAAVIENVFIAAEAISCCGSVGQVILSGQITRLALEKASGAIVASVLVANLPFTGILTERQVCEHALYPGRMAHICYAIDSVKWV
ncbi:MAG: energy-coupling factor ABC transporter ATP-binding protein [Hyphomicrobiales bacterium]